MIEVEIKIIDGRRVLEYWSETIQEIHDLRKAQHQTFMQDAEVEYPVDDDFRIMRVKCGGG